MSVESVIIPAQPGYYVLFQDGGDGDLISPPCHGDTVIAWEVGRHSCRSGSVETDIYYTRPITIHAGAETSEFLLCPDGSVVEMGGGGWESIEKASQSLSRRGRIQNFWHDP